MRLTTLISDCDGVLIDSEIVAFRVLIRETQTAFPDVDVTAYLSGRFGQKTEDLVQQFCAHIGRAVPDGFLLQLRRVIDDEIEVQAQGMAGIEHLVRIPQLKAVVSNSSMPRVRAAMQRVGLDKRTDVQVFSADQVAAPKPAPDLYRLAAQTLAVKPTECLVIEDSLSGIAAAQAAGMAVIGFAGGTHISPEYERQMQAAGVLAVVQRMNDLPACLDRLTDWNQTDVTVQ